MDLREKSGRGYWEDHHGVSGGGRGGGNDILYVKIGYAVCGSR